MGGQKTIWVVKKNRIYYQNGLNVGLKTHYHYCDDCPYADTSKVAKALFGYQCAGYCYYLGKGDYSFSRSTSILWDGCKECGIHDYEGNGEDF